jgi:hypothetical protein
MNLHEDPVMPRHAHVQVSGSLTPTTHRALRVQLAMNAETFQDWLERSVKQYIGTEPPAPRRPIKRAEQRGDRP